MKTQNFGPRGQVWARLKSERVSGNCKLIAGPQQESGDLGDVEIGVRRSRAGDGRKRATNPRRWIGESVPHVPLVSVISNQKAKDRNSTSV